MIRRYCDACGTEIEKSYATDRLKHERTFRPEGRVVRIGVEVNVSVNGTWNSGDVCRDCVIDAVMAADTRPQEDPAGVVVSGQAREPD